MIHQLPTKTILDLNSSDLSKRTIISLHYTCQASTLIGNAQKWQVFFSQGMQR